MIRQTSIQSYHKTKKQRETQIIRQQIITLLHRYKNLSRNDIQRILNHHHNKHIKNSTISARINELIQEGKIAVAGKKKDRITNRQVEILHPIRSGL